MYQEIEELLRTKDSFAALERIERQGDALAVADLYKRLVRDLYNEAKDVSGTILVGRAGIHYCLTKAIEVEGADKELAEKLRGAAKALSYNTAASGWPAWAEPGMRVTEEHMRAGYDCARLNRRLAYELDRPPGPKGNGLWLMGAHHLAAGEYEEATRAFEQARDIFDSVPEPDYALMTRGYIVIVRLTQNPGDGGAQDEFETTVRALRERGNEDATFFADQLETVRAYFVTG